VYAFVPERIKLICTVISTSIGKLGNHAAHESQPKGDAQSPVDGMAPQKAR